MAVIFRPEAQNIFEQINGVYKKVDDLTEIMSKIGHGALSDIHTFDERFFFEIVQRVSPGKAL